jgi:hypothetical protein
MNTEEQTEETEEEVQEAEALAEDIYTPSMGELMQAVDKALAEALTSFEEGVAEGLEDSGLFE